MLAWVAIFSTDSRRVTQCRHATKIPSPQLLLFPALTDRDGCNSCSIRSYENCRVSTQYPIYPPTLLFSSPAFRTFFQVPYPVTPLLATLTKTAGGVYQQFPLWNSFPYESGNSLSFTPSDKISSLPTPSRQGPGKRGITMSKTTAANDRMNRPLDSVDPQIASLLRDEARRQATGLELIPSENLVSEAVLEAMGSIFTNKYAEGYPGKRYYGGCEYADKVEQLAIDRAKELYGAEHANVQAHSGTSANVAVYMSALQKDDVVLGMNLSHGGHLTHGHPLNFSGRMYKFIAYGVRKEDDRRGCECLFAHHRLRAHRQSREIRRRPFLRGHGAHRRPRRRWRAPQSHSACRHRFHHHTQNAARATRRIGLVQSRLCKRTRQAHLSRHARRAASPYHGRQSRLPERSHGAVVQGLSETSSSQHQG